jgi:hypothetical protein
MREMRTENGAFQLPLMRDVDRVFRSSRYLVARLDTGRDDVVAVEAAGARLGDGAENAVIGAATAQMAGQRRAELLARGCCRSGGCAPLVVKGCRLDDEAWGAEPALQGVVTDLSAAVRAGIRQLATGAPSSSTVHAPQTPAPQTSFVPVRCSVSRTTSTSSASGSSGRVARRPLIVIVLIGDLRVVGISRKHSASRDATAPRVYR